MTSSKFLQRGRYNIMNSKRILSSIGKGSIKPYAIFKDKVPRILTLGWIMAHTYYEFHLYTLDEEIHKRVLIAYVYR